MNELRLFHELKAYHLPDLESAKDQFSKWDCVSHSYKLLIELKSRKTHYGSLLIEKIKYDSLRARAKKMGYKPMYVNWTPKGIYVFNLDNLDLSWEKNFRNPATSEFGNRSKVQKEVAYIPIESGKYIKVKGS